MLKSVTSDADTTLARNLMVDGQLRPNRVTDRRILDAMRALKRETFVPPAQAALAYIDQDIPLGRGRVLLKPLVIARLLQLARPRAGETALVVGAGTGYGAAILAATGAHVVALEEDADLAATARRLLTGTANVTVVHGKLAEGFAASAPYDLIVIEGAVPAIPDAIGAQVAAGGRLAAILCVPGHAGTAVLAEPSTGGKLSVQPAFDAAAPYLGSLAPSPGFTF
jgi:protein-L-isoaspartate(D-aspartate) O-methyltransferase